MGRYSTNSMASNVVDSLKCSIFSQVAKFYFLRKISISSVFKFITIKLFMVFSYCF